MTIEEGLAQYIANVSYEDLSVAAIESAKRSTLDTIGAMIAGSTSPGVGAVVEMTRGWGGNREAHLVAFGDCLPAPAAALCNGTMARAREIDDCVDFLPVHPSASAVPALFAFAELNGCLSGKDFITSLAVGQDIKIRMGLAVRHNAMVSGRNNMFKIFGPTAALAKAADLSAKAAQNALGLSFSFAVGDGQCALEGALSLRLQQGLVAQGALLAVLLTERGFTGARDFLLGRFGYLRAFEPDPRLDYLTQDLGTYFYGERITIKPYSSCRATHPSIELALKMRKSIAGRPVEQITLDTCPGVYHLVGEPSEKELPKTSSAAQFSLQFTVAAALTYGDVFLDQLESRIIQDRELIDLAKRVVVKPDESLNTDSVLGRTRMEVRLEDGQVLVDDVELPLGSPSRPLSYDECVQKFRKCCEHAANTIEPHKLGRLIESVSNMERVDNVAELVQWMF